MDWIEIIIQVSTGDCEIAAAIASMTAPYGIYIEDYADMDTVLPQIGWVDAVDDELLARDRTSARIHIYIPAEANPAEAAAFVEERLAAEGIAYAIETQTIREDDWANNWKQYYKPLRIGSRMVICPSWEDYAPQLNDVVLRLDPGSAFGTGQHETTRLCLELLERTVQSGEQLLDMGCGSGILSIAALALGADMATAVDIDPNAAETAARNAADNGFGDDRYRTLAGNVLTNATLSAAIGDGYDRIAANIVADVIIPMASIFFDKLKPGGELIASGIIGQRANEVEAALAESGFQRLERAELADWVALCMRKI